MSSRSGREALLPSERRPANYTAEWPFRPASYAPRRSDRSPAIVARPRSASRKLLMSVRKARAKKQGLESTPIPTSEEKNLYETAKDENRMDLFKINERRQEYIAKNPLPILDEYSAYPIDRGEYNYEENLSDGNCFYYSVIRAMERRAFPDGKHITNSKEKKAINSLLTPDAVRIFKTQITNFDKKPQNKGLMDQLSIKKEVDGREVPAKLTEDKAWAEDVSIQATANYLNCCIYVFVPKGFHSSFESPQPIPISHSWEVYFPDNDASGPSRAEKMFSEAIPVMILQSVRGTGNSTTQSKIKLNDLVYSLEDIRPYTDPVKDGKFFEGYVQDDYRNDTKRSEYRAETIERYLEEFKTINDNECIDENNSIYIMFKKEGHFVYIEPKKSISQPPNENLKKKYEELKEGLRASTAQGRRRSKKGKKRRQSRQNQNSKSGNQSKHRKKGRKSSKKEKKNN